MKKLILFLFLIPLTSFSSESVIYGEDNRVDVSKTTNPNFSRYARSTLARINRESIKGWTFNKIWELKTQTLEESGVCKSEKFSEQPVVAGCTAFLVSPKHILTSGHCISNQTCGNGMYYWLFDYNMPASGAFNPRFHKNNYVSCKRIVKRVLDPTTHNDYALIELKSAVTNRKPLAFRRSGQVNIGEPLVVIGHPSGLPTKIADGAEVKAINETFLTANLDTFGGNDGSPVINVNTGLVEGILVRGAEDYEIDSENNCKKAARLPNEAAVESATLVLGIKELQAL